MLNGKLELHGLDAEEFSLRAIRRAAGRDALSWSEWKREELLADTVSYLWELSVRYDETIGTFGGYANRHLAWFIIDWIRKREGRTRFQFGPEAQHLRVEFRQSGGVYERPRRQHVPLDGELAESLGSRRLDPASCSDTDLRGVLDRGDSPKAWASTEEDREDVERPTSRAA